MDGWLVMVTANREKSSRERAGERGNWGPLQQLGAEVCV